MKLISWEKVTAIVRTYVFTRIFCQFWYGFRAARNVTSWPAAIPLDSFASQIYLGQFDESAGGENFITAQPRKIEICLECGPSQRARKPYERGTKTV